MRKIHETGPNMVYPYGESATRLIVYALDTEDEFWEVSDLLENGKHNELEDMFDVQGEYNFIPAGERFVRYSFEILGDFVVITETIAYNV